MIPPRGAAMLWLLAMVICGCASERIPRYPRMPQAQTLAFLRDRSGGIDTVSAQGSLRLTRADGRSVILDAAIALQPPERARIRAWKFGRAVFDLTLAPDGVYVYAPSDSTQREELGAAGSRAGEMLRNWLGLISGSFDPGDSHESGSQIIVRHAEAGGSTLISTIDRPTITPRAFRLLDPQGIERFSLTLGRYTESNEHVWPTRIEAVSEAGRLRLDLREVEINSGLPEAAFRPPARAEKMP